MGLTRVAISRPLFILMVILGMVIMGAVSYTRLGVELFPSISTPVVTVVTAYPGASPEDVERLVTRPIEDAVAGINNVDVLSSSSTEGVPPSPSSSTTGPTPTSPPPMSSGG